VEMKQKTKARDPRCEKSAVRCLSTLKNGINGVPERQSHEPVLETQRPSWKRRKQKQEEEHAARVLVAKQANSKLRRVLDDISDNNAEPLKELVITCGS